MRRVLVLVLTTALVLASCGGNDDDDASTLEETTEATPPADLIDPDDQEVAERAVLTLDDLPPGWRQETPDERDDPDFDAAECGQIREAGQLARSKQTASAEGGPFTRNQAQVEVTVASTVTTEPLEEFYDAFQDVDLVNTCLTALLEEAMAEAPDEADSAEIDDIRVGVGRLSIPSYGDDTFAYQAEVEVVLEGLSPSVYVDVVFVRVGRFTANFFFQDVLGAFPTDEQEEIISTVVDRLTSENDAT
jgi:hypothetical protein